MPDPYTGAQGGSLERSADPETQRKIAEGRARLGEEDRGWWDGYYTGHWNDMSPDDRLEGFRNPCPVCGDTDFLVNDHDHTRETEPGGGRREPKCNRCNSIIERHAGASTEESIAFHEALLESLYRDRDRLNASFTYAQGG